MQTRIVHSQEVDPCAPKAVRDELSKLAISIDDEHLDSIFSICPRLLPPGRWISPLWPFHRGRRGVSCVAAPQQ
jgi:hypothetical protein